MNCLTGNLQQEQPQKTIPLLVVPRHLPLPHMRRLDSGLQEPAG